MRAISLWQPWCSLILHGFKPYEFRSWHPGERMIGQRIALHAARRIIPKGELAELIVRAMRPDQIGLRPGAGRWLLEHAVPPSRLPHGVILATAVLAEVQRANRVLSEFGGPVANDSDRDEQFNFAWRLEDVQPVMPPDPVRGRQGWFEWGGVDAAAL